MGDLVSQHNIGARLKTLTSVAPQLAAAGTINGASIDRGAHGMPMSCVMHTATGAIAGAPTTTSAQSTLQHSPDNSTWANYTDPNTSALAQGVAMTAANGDQDVAVDLTLANRYLRVVEVVAFTGGASPTVATDAKLILGGESENPAT